MNLDEARTHIGRDVAYHREGEVQECGIIEATGAVLVFVRYPGGVRGTDPKDLMVNE